MDRIECDLCNLAAEGEITYEDGEILVGCSYCLLDIVADPKKPVHSIHEYTKKDLQTKEG